MIQELPTLSDVDYSNKAVLLRIDINAPIIDSKILDTTRFESHVPTIKELEDSKLVLLAHQSRPGKNDFTTLDSHAKVLSRLLGREVEYIDDIFGRCAIERIKSLENGEILLLENVRFYSEEQLKRDAETHSRSHLVRKLKPYFDLYVNDAFSASHRPHASLIGFPPVLPSVVGRLVEKEVKALSKVLEAKGNKVFILGGTKIKDSVKVMKNVLAGKIAEKVVLTGVVANYFLMLSGVNIGEENERIVNENKEDLNDLEMKKFYEKFKDKIILPKDFGVEIDGKREDISVDDFKKGKIKDIGINTISELCEIIPEFDVAVINGPCGVFEEEKFAIGTFEVLRAMTKAEYSVVGGGHIATAARLINVSKKVSHVSTGGGACVRFLSGEKLVALETIRKYWESKWKKVFQP